MDNNPLRGRGNFDWSLAFWAGACATCILLGHAEASPAACAGDRNRHETPGEKVVKISKIRRDSYLECPRRTTGRQVNGIEARLRIVYDVSF